MGYSENLERARSLLGIPLHASSSQIRQRFRSAVKAAHPDVAGGNDPEQAAKTRELIEAYKLLIEYCADFPVDFSPSAVSGQISLEEFWMMKFGNDPTWGKGDKNGRY